MVQVDTTNSVLAIAETLLSRWAEGNPFTLVTTAGTYTCHHSSDAYVILPSCVDAPNVEHLRMQSRITADGPSSKVLARQVRDGVDDFFTVYADIESSNMPGVTRRTVAVLINHLVGMEIEYSR